MSQRVRGGRREMVDRLGVLVCLNMAPPGPKIGDEVIEGVRCDCTTAMGGMVKWEMVIRSAIRGETSE